MSIRLISGGTSGIGKALASHFLSQGDTVIIIGRDKEKGQQFLANAQNTGSATRAHFLQADLQLVSENKRIIEAIKAQFSVIDTIILCAQYFSSTRHVTSEGFEQTFSLYYLSRFLLSYNLLPLLHQSSQPVIFNICGPDGPGKNNSLNWTDLQFERTPYSGFKAMMQSSRANDLLGAGFALTQQAGQVSYILYNPGLTATSFAGEYDLTMNISLLLAKPFAKSVEKGIMPIIELLTNPPAGTISAFNQHKPVDLTTPAFNQENARKLYQETHTLLSR